MRYIYICGELTCGAGGSVVFDHAKPDAHFLDFRCPLANEGHGTNNPTGENSQYRNTAKNVRWAYNVPAAQPSCLSDFFGRPSTMRARVWIVLPSLRLQISIISTIEIYLW
jgi:hypothetical protein